MYNNSHERRHYPLVLLLLTRSSVSRQNSNILKRFSLIQNQSLYSEYKTWRNTGGLDISDIASTFAGIPTRCGITIHVTNGSRTLLYLMDVLLASVGLCCGWRSIQYNTFRLYSHRTSTLIVVSLKHCCNIVPNNNPRLPSSFTALGQRTRQCHYVIHSK